MSTVRPLSDVFTARAIGMAWNNYQQTLGEAPFLGRSKFGTRKQQGLDLKFIKGKNGLPVSLKASAFDAQAELRDGIGFTEVQNEMPFFRESIMVTEKEEQEYASFVESTNVQYANQVLQNIMKKPIDLVRGARVIPERMIWQLLCPANGVPKVEVKVGSSSYTIGYIDSADQSAYLASNYSDISASSTDAWDKKTTATPLQDLIDIKRDFAKNTGYSLSRFTMNTETFQLLIDANDTKLQVLGVTAANAGIRMKQSQVIDYLAEYGIEIEIYDKMYKDESGTAKYFVPTGYISCQSAGVYLGDFVFGTTPEERSGDVLTGSLSTVDTGISIYTYATNHPVNTHSVVSMLGLPTYEGMDSVFTFKVKA